MVKPLIGVTFDAREPGGYSRYPWYALRKNYCEALSRHGAATVVLPYDLSSVGMYAEMLQGLLVTGGGFDVDPRHYKATYTHSSVQIIPERTDFELAMIQAMDQRRKPVFGICGGEQVMNVVRGGSLIQHIPDEVPHAILHSQEGCRTQACHAVQITSGSKLQAVVKKETIVVNSVHHQAVKEVGRGLVAAAHAEDGIIEGIEDPERPCFIGVQWHPEFSVTSADSDLLAYFVACCGEGLKK